MEKQLYSKIESILKNDLNFLNVHIGNHTDLTTREMKVIFSSEALDDIQKLHNNDALEELKCIIASAFCLEVLRYVDMKIYEIARKVDSFDDNLLNEYDTIIVSPEIAKKYFGKLCQSTSILFFEKLSNTTYKDMLLPFNRMILFKKSAIKYYTKNILTVKENNRIDHDFKLELDPEQVLVVELGDFYEAKN